MSCLYILEINPLSVISFANTFSHSEGFSSHLAYSFLCCAKAFKFNHVPLVYFCFDFYYSRRWVIEDLALIYVSATPVFLPGEFQRSLTGGCKESDTTELLTLSPHFRDR